MERFNLKTNNNNNMKNLLSTPGKKVIAALVLLLAIAGVALGLNYRSRSNEALRGDFQFVLNAEPVEDAASEPVAELALNLQPAANEQNEPVLPDANVENAPVQQAEFQLDPDLLGGNEILPPDEIIDPEDPDVINVIDPSMIDDLGLGNKLSVWLSSGQGMHVEDGQIRQWDDISGNGRHVRSPNNGQAPNGSKITGPNCSDFNCQYAPYFSNNDYMQSVKNIDRVQELFVVFDLGDQVFQGEDLPVINFSQTVPYQGGAKNLPNTNLSGGSSELPYSGINVKYQDQSKLRVGMNSYDIKGCVAGNPQVNTDCVYSYSITETSQQTPWGEEALSNPILIHFMADANSGEEKLYINGVEVVDTPNSLPTLGTLDYETLIDEPFFLGANEDSDDSGRFFNGKIGEVIILNDNASAEEQKEITSYLTTKFGITKGRSYPFAKGNVVPPTPGNPIWYQGNRTIKFPGKSGFEFAGNYNFGTVAMAKLTNIGLLTGMDEIPFATSTQRQHFLSIGQPSQELGNGDYLFIGHNRDLNNDGNEIFPNQWSGEDTSDGFEMLTRKWQGKRSNSFDADSFVMSVKLTPENELTENLENVMLVQDEMIVAEPNSQTDYAIALMDINLSEANSFAYEGKDANKYALLRDDGQMGDMVANDNIYSTRLMKDDIDSSTFFTLVRGPDGSFDPDEPEDDPGNDPGDNPGDNPGDDDDTGVDIEVQTKQGNQNDDAPIKYQIGNGFAAFFPTPKIYADQTLASLNGTNEITFSFKANHSTPETVVIENRRINEASQGVKLTLNGQPYELGTEFENGDKLVVEGTYIFQAIFNPGEGDDCEEGQVWDQELNECVPNANQIFFRITTEEEDGTQLNEGYSYNGEPYAPTPTVFGKNISDFGDQPGLLAKTIAFEPKEGFVTPGTLKIDDRQISEYPKNVDVFLNGDQVTYPLNEDSVFVEGNTMVVKGIYLEAAQLIVEIDGPDGFPGGPVEVGDEEKDLENGEKEEFDVDPDEDTEVICPEVAGYNLVSNNPIVVPEEDLEAGEETNVTCEYESVSGGDTEIIVSLHNAPDGGDVEVPGSNEDEQFIDQDDAEVFTFDEGGNYIVICPDFEDEGYILISDDPIEVEVDDGETESVSCEYSNTGSKPYNPDDPPEFGTEESCLTYRDRNLVFTDLEEGQIGYAEAQVLKNTAFSPRTTTEDIEEAVENFPLSGFGSNLTGDNITQSRVDLPGRATRMQVTLLTMQLYCLPIFQGTSLPDERIDGEPMPEVNDLPMRGTVAHDVVMTAFFYGILEGYNYPGNRNYTPGVPNTVRWNDTITNWQLIKVINNAQQNWQGYQNISDFNLARQYGFDSNDWAYTFIARALRRHYPDSAILQVPTVLRTFERNIIRGEMIALLWHNVARDGVYYPDDEDEAWDAYEDLI